MNYGVNSVDALELLYCSRAMRMCQEIFDKHPDWEKNSGKVIQRLALDYSKPSNWNSAKLLAGKVDLHGAWISGRPSASQVLAKISKFTEGVTLLKPFGKSKVGASSINLDYSLDTESPEDLEQHVMVTPEVNEYVSSIIDLIEERSTSSPRIDNQTLIDGKYHFKASVVRQLFNGSPSSRDRLRRVQGLSKYCENEDVILGCYPSGGSNISCSGKFN